MLTPTDWFEFIVVAVIISVDMDIDRSAESVPQQELTPEQVQLGDMFVEVCGLQDVADMQLEMHGVMGSVRYGLGRCSEYLMDNTPDEIQESVLLKLEQQKASTQQPAGIARATD